MTDPTRRLRKREDLEALAREFVATPSADIPGPLLRPVSTFTAVGALAVAVLTLIMLWPRVDDAPRASVAARATMREAEHLQQRVDAQRERAKASDRMRLSDASLDRMAKADQALLREMSARARRLAVREAPATAANVEPTPKNVAPARVAMAEAAKPAPTAPTAPAAPAAPAAAMPKVAAAPAASCAISVSDLSASGKLTYADIAHMKGGRVDANGHAFTPPVSLAGRTVVFEVAPNGCVTIVR